MGDSQQRLQALDALRGIAALAVVLFHYLPYYHELYGHSFTPWAWLEFGRYGVHLFFILSGFVIFMTLERTRSAGWFAMARSMRLLPGLWAGIVITWLFVAALGETPGQDAGLPPSDESGPKLAGVDVSRHPLQRGGTRDRARPTRSKGR